MSKGIELIAVERRRQIEKEGWTAEHDKQHKKGEMALAAACYAIPEERRYDMSPIIEGDVWPWAPKWWKPTPGDRVRELTKAGALIAAEIDRICAKRKGIR